MLQCNKIGRRVLAKRDCSTDARPGPTATRQAVDLPHLRGAFHRGGVERALPRQSEQGPDRAVGCLRSADPDRLRQRPPAGPRRSRQGRRADLPSRRHAGAVRKNSARHHEHLDDDQCHGGMAAGTLCRAGRRAGRSAARAGRHHAERYRQGISVARHLRVSAGAVAATHQGRDSVHHQRDAEVESDQRLLLSPAGGRRDAGAGAGVCARHRDSGAGRGAGVGSMR